MLGFLLLGLSWPPDVPADAITLGTRHVVWTIGADGRNLSFRDRKTGRDWANPGGSVAFFVRVGSEFVVPSKVRRDRNQLEVLFGDAQASAVFRVSESPEAIVLEVVEVQGPVEELTFGQIPLTLKGDETEPVAVCTLARNLRTNVPELPGASSILRAIAYRHLGFEGASAAFVTSTPRALRGALKRAVSAAPELPRSPIGGPWAMDSPDNKRSYLFNFGGLNATTAQKWTDLARALGATQIDFHGGVSFRFGDLVPNPETYPKGLSDLKATVDRLHTAGIKAGLHTYSFFIDKRSKYVTPVPDARLATARVFTLAEPVDETSDTLTVLEPTAGVTATTGFFTSNSATLRLGEELITFREATQEPPYRFLGCTRGALGTRALRHEAGAKAHHLKELFGLFAPDPKSELFLEIIENTARVYNECGFDMIYLDALDGSYILEGPEWAWYHGARFVYELMRRLKKPPIIEMSTFHHHLWCVRSRMGAWDAPRTGYKEFVDMHRVVNRDCQRMFLPSHLGWWGVFTWNGVQPERTFPDDLEYLMGKALADDAGVSFVHGFDPDTFPKSPGAQRYAQLIRRYEDLRKSRAVPPELRKRLGTPGEEYRLIDGPRGKRAFVPVNYHRVVMEGADSTCRVPEGFSKEPSELRLEVCLSSAAAPAATAPLLGAGDIAILSPLRCAEGVRLEVDAVSGLQTESEGQGPPHRYLRLTATSTRSSRRGAWAMVERVFDPPLNMERKGLGVWIHGDGKGAVLNFQLRNRDNVGPGVAEHYVVVDFVGWRYVTLIEPESDRLSDYSWPYAAHRSEWEQNPGLAFTSGYKVYHPWLNYSVVAALAVWINEIPENGGTSIGIGDVMALPVASCTLRDPTVTVGGLTVRFPCELTSGEYLEWDGTETATIYGPDNAVRRTIPLERLPSIPAPPPYTARFLCQPTDGALPRVRLTLIRKGEPLSF